MLGRPTFAKIANENTNNANKKNAKPVTRAALGTLSNNQINTQRSSNMTSSQKIKSFTIAPPIKELPSEKPLRFQKLKSPDKYDDEIDFVHPAPPIRPFDCGLSSETITKAIDNMNKLDLEEILNTPPEPMPLDDEFLQSIEDVGSESEDNLFPNAKDTMMQISKIIENQPTTETSKSSEEFDISPFLFAVDEAIKKMIDEEKGTSESKSPNKKEETPLMLQNKIENEKEKLDIFNDQPLQQRQRQEEQFLSDKKNNSEIKPIKTLIEKSTKKLLDNNSNTKKKGLRPAESSTLNRKNAKLLPTTTNNNIKDKKLTTASGTSTTTISKLIPIKSSVLDKENISTKKPFLSTTKSSSSSSSVSKNLAYRLRD